MHRTIKSYVLRAGRISNRQQQALEQWLSDYELVQTQSPWNLVESFQREADTIVEIGFGMGASLLTMAKNNPHLNFIGIEVHRAGVGSLVAELHDQSLTNVRIATFDAAEVFQTYLKDNSLSGVQIFFPDPWPKKRHHKRRLIQQDFIRLVTSKLKPGAFLHCATDWEEYALHMMQVLLSEPYLTNQYNQDQFAPRPETRPYTKFEARGLNLGHNVWDLVFLREN